MLEIVCYCCCPEQNKLTLAWRGPYKVVCTVGEVDYKIEINPGKVKIYHINMLKRYFHHENEQKEVVRNVDKGKQKGRIINGVGSGKPEINQTLGDENIFAVLYVSLCYGPYTLL